MFLNWKNENCVNCENGCKTCVDSVDCVDSVNLVNCINMDGCQNCIDSKNCEFSNNCIECDGLTDKITGYWYRNESVSRDTFMQLLNARGYDADYFQSNPTFWK